MSMIDQDRINVLKCRINGYARWLDDMQKAVAKWKKIDPMMRQAILHDCRAIAIGMMMIRKELKRELPPEE